MNKVLYDAGSILYNRYWFYPTTTISVFKCNIGGSTHE